MPSHEIRVSGRLEGQEVVERARTLAAGGQLADKRAHAMPARGRDGRGARKAYGYGRFSRSTGCARPAESKQIRDFPCTSWALAPDQVSTVSSVIASALTTGSRHSLATKSTRPTTDLAGYCLAMKQASPSGAPRRDARSSSGATPRGRLPRPPSRTLNRGPSNDTASSLSSACGAAGSVLVGSPTAK